MDSMEMRTGLDYVRDEITSLRHQYIELTEQMSEFNRNIENMSSHGFSEDELALIAETRKIFDDEAKAVMKEIKNKEDYLRTTLNIRNSDKIRAELLSMETNAEELVKMVGSLNENINVGQDFLSASLTYKFKERGIVGAFKKAYREHYLLKIDAAKRDIEKAIKNNEEIDKRIEAIQQELKIRRFNGHYGHKDRLFKSPGGLKGSDKSLEKEIRKNSDAKQKNSNKIEECNRRIQENIDKIRPSFEKSLKHIQAVELAKACKDGRIFYDGQKQIYYATRDISPERFDRLTRGFKAVSKDGILIHDGRDEKYSNKEILNMVNRERNEGKMKISRDPSNPHQYIEEIKEKINQKNKDYQSDRNRLVQKRMSRGIPMPERVNTPIRPEQSQEVREKTPSQPEKSQATKERMSSSPRFNREDYEHNMQLLKEVVNSGNCKNPLELGAKNVIEFSPLLDARKDYIHTEVEGRLRYCKTSNELNEFIQGLPPKDREFAFATAIEVVRQRTEREHGGVLVNTHEVVKNYATRILMDNPNLFENSNPVFRAIWEKELDAFNVMTKNMAKERAAEPQKVQQKSPERTAKQNTPQKSRDRTEQQQRPQSRTQNRPEQQRTNQRELNEIRELIRNLNAFKDRAKNDPEMSAAIRGLDHAIAQVERSLNDKSKTKTYTSTKERTSQEKAKIPTHKNEPQQNKTVSYIQQEEISVVSAPSQAESAPVTADTGAVRNVDSVEMNRAEDVSSILVNESKLYENIYEQDYGREYYSSEYEAESEYLDYEYESDDKYEEHAQVPEDDAPCFS